MTTRDVLSRLTVAALILAGSTATASASTASVRNLCTPSIVTNEVVATADARRAAGKLVKPPSLIDPANGVAWPDTPLGAIRSRDGVSWLFFGSETGDSDTVGERYYIYFTNYPNDGTGWARAELRRLTVSCSPPRP